METSFEDRLTRDELLALRNKRTGMLVFQISWIMTFVCLVVVNWQLRFSPNWMPEGTDSLSPVLPTAATIGLIISAGLARRALQAVRAGAQAAFLRQWAGAMVLGALFVAIMLYEWFTVQTGTQYAQVFRLMTGFHSFHAFVIGLYMFSVYRTGQRETFGAHNFWLVEAGAKLWYFVLVAWLLFYIVIYWV